MKILGIESSCDECAAAVVEDGRWIRSNVVATQIPLHARYKGVVPEIASRTHTEWIYAVVQEALGKAGVAPSDLDGVGVTARPGLLGSLLVGLSFAKAFAWAQGLPFIAVDHLLAHLYAAQLSESADDLSAPPGYPFLGLLVSGGHSLICRVDAFDVIKVLGSTLDDAVGEAFDKVAAYYDLGYPGGVAIDTLARTGDPSAFAFPLPKLKGEHPYDLSYSGLKSAVINQLGQFQKNPALPVRNEDIAASFQKTAVDMLLRSLFRAAADTGLRTIVAGGGVAANSYLRKRLEERRDLQAIFPPPSLCGDNGAMIAGLSYPYLIRGDRSPLTTQATCRHLP
ncbi:MAG: tRNA (adenosine(37)-N6)-threonylcarbamoyltransferase complex transferase subunit TsaD [Spirochaetaceae bacterium]|jgi:N6-L-threonylcarbamoyladenine synthase|nr:tRNA (adenosine(37)-N6)-threonylcarbamoyltransferase complex transferase subunit TsaD [Spirochaetaceae bacterium]